MRGRLLGVVGGALILALALFWGFFDWNCGPAKCGNGGWLYDYQTLVSGVLAILAAGATAWVVIHAARIPIEAQRQRDRELRNARRDYLRAVLMGEIFTIATRARQAASTVKTYKASTHEITDDGKEKLYLTIPHDTQDWEAMAVLGTEVIKEWASLRHLIDEHNFDIKRAGGAFGDDNFGRKIMSRAEAIAAAAQQFAGKTLNNLKSE